jgi:hypothetical protein
MIVVCRYVGSILELRGESEQQKWRGDESQRFYSFTDVLYALHKISRRKMVDIAASPADYTRCLKKQQNFRNEFLICR